MFTYYQTSFGTPNRLVGPNKISPIYHYVVAINNDTVYASSFLDLSMEPVILTIPPTPVNYSVLTLDRYCDIFHSELPANTSGTYALYGPGFDPNNLPITVTPVPLPFNYMALIFRADRFKLVNGAALRLSKPELPGRSASRRPNQDRARNRVRVTV